MGGGLLLELFPFVFVTHEKVFTRGGNLMGVSFDVEGSYETFDVERIPDRVHGQNLGLLHDTVAFADTFRFFTRCLLLALSDKKAFLPIVQGT